MANIDNRIVEMTFDNRQFESGVRTTLSTLDKLRQALNFDKSSQSIENLEATGRKFSLSSMAENVESISNKFTALGIIGVTALQNITNSAMAAGKQLIAAFTIDPVKTGFAEYETQINAVQTILANTSHAGTTIGDVNKALDELNHYADMTIYNFTEMTRNIGTFTAAGVDLDTSVAAIKGIANLAAVSGSTSQQASTAMYQLSQALAAGTVKLQDWNSVVNAGMGGKVFQDALIETAKVHGWAMDEMIKDEGSFRETLQNGWLTSEILTETLQKFTGDLTKEQILSMGYTEQQAEAILKMGVTANDAATKVKTFTQLMDTLKEAAQSGWTQSWEIIIGDFEEAKELLTEVSDAFSEMINASANARNEVLQGWKDLGGRTALIEAFRNALKGIASVVKPIKDAFRDIFPSITAQQLFNMTKGLEEFTKHLILGDQNSERLKETFKGLFSVIKIVVDIIGLFIKGLTELISHAAPLGELFLAITGALGKFISELDLFSNTSVDKIKPFESLGKVIKTIYDNISDVTKGFGPVFKNLGDVIQEAFGYVQKAIDNTIGSINLDNISKAFGTGFFGMLVYSAKNFFDTLSEAVDGIGDISGILDSVKGSLEAWQSSLKADALIKIAKAVGLLTISLIGLSTIEPDKMIQSLGALTVIFAELTGALILFEKYSMGIGVASLVKTSTAMIAMSTAVLVLAGAMKVLSSMDWDGLSKGLIGIAGLFTMLSISTKYLSANSVKLKVSSVKIIALAGAIVILSTAVEKLGSLEITTLLKGLAGVASILTELSIFGNVGLNSKGMISTAISMNLLGTAMLIFSSAIEKMGSLSLAEIAKGLLTMAGALTSVTVAMNFMPKNILSTSISLIAVSGALVILSNALTTMGGMEWNEIGKGILTLGTSLTILVTAMNLAKGSLSGAAALTVMSGALTLLAGSIKILSTIPIAGVGTALVTLAGTFTILGVAGIALGPMIPTLLGLAGAIALLGVGTAAVGAGVLAFATGITTLAAAVAAGGLSITSVITGIVSLIPMIITKVGEGFISLLKLIGESGKAILDSVSTIIQSVLGAITTNLPLIVESGMKIILGILDGINKNIYQITEIAISIVIKFIQAIESKLPEIVNTAFNFIITFINTLANTIETQAPVLFKAMGNLASAMISGLVKGLASGVGEVVNGVKSLGESAIKGLKEVLGIHSPSKEFAEIGEYSAEGFALGLQNGSSLAIESMKDTLTGAVSELSTYYTKFQDAGIWLGDGFFEGLTDGINKINMVSKDLDEPSKEAGTESGTSLTSGFETGVKNTQSVATSSVNNMMNGAIESLQSFKSLFEMTGIEVADGFWDGFDSSMSKLQSFKGIDNLGDTFGDSGTDALTSLTEGITNGIPDAVKSTISMSDQILASLDGRNPDYTQAGQNLVDAFTKGIKNSTNIAVSAAGVMASKSDSELDRYYNTFYLTGTALVQGFANGITEETWLAEARARAMANAAYEAAMEELDAHSPSRRFMKVGDYVAKGFAIGMSNGIKVVENSSKNLADHSLSIATTTLQKITDAISSNDMTPVITPVLDLSNIQNGTKTISSMFARNQISAIGNLKSEKISGENSAETNPIGNVYQFTQNNYSPKALSRLDIYRQTKNQFSELRGLTS